MKHPVYPTSLFTFNNSIKLFRCGKFEAFVYIFLYSLWNECLLNKKIDNGTRLYLLSILQLILIVLYEELSTKKLPVNIGFKKSKNNEYLTIFTLEKMQRWISTVALQIFVIYLNNLRTGLNRLRSHCTEQQNGQIHSFCLK